MKQAVIAGKIPLILLLVTPSHVELLKDDATVIPNIIGRAFHSYEIGQEFHVLAAVVDRVTWPKLEKSVPFPCSKMPKRDGAEGFTVCILDSETAAPDLWTTRGLPIGKEPMSNSKQSTLSFILQPSQESVEARIKHVPPQPVATRLVQLPVANTVFRNGRPSTLLAQRWVITEIHGRLTQTKSRLTEEVSLPQQVLRMTDVVHDVSHQFGYSLSAPIEPITAPRIVGTAMGNIIRSIYIGDSPGDSVPASTELEKAVASVYQTSEPQREIVGIWALVTPREYRVGQPYVRTAEIQRLIDSGSRLHKVLSGGGGWGNKQGLLALDPDSEYSKDKEATQKLFGHGDDIEAEKLEALGQVVKPGDVVSFWAHFAKRLEEKIAPSTKDTKGVEDIKVPSTFKITIPPSMVFGTIPSTMDPMPSSVATTAEGTASPLYTLIMNHFGMFSEQGMSLKVSTVGPEDQNALGVEKVGVVVQTKLDVPYSHVSIVGKGKTMVQSLRGKFRKI